jgi:cellulose synthase/poly-beta-1,6-N-acetylglucosamine synthase-like glycosyltransferase
MNRLDAAVLAIYYLALGILAIYSLHRLYLVRLRRSHALGAPAPPTPLHWPSLTVQLPLFNEPNVAARLIDAVAALSYPGPFSIQVLDDSTDVTTEIVSAKVAAHRERGVTIEHIRRSSRDGYKAGALAYGMSRTGSELLAVFDADFVPAPDLLVKMVPHFADRGVGMEQARWTHLNREQSLLTRVQAIYLDGHFAVESAARHLGGRFFNFNGTAGIWRRDAIAGAGGWSASTLTEDLDLSYRAQLSGWRFVFVPDVEVPAELPSTLSGFQEQQHRWAKGSIQTARKLLRQIVGSDLPSGVKSEAFFHLTNNTAYLLTTVVALLMVPAIIIRQRLGLTWTLVFDVALFGSSSGSVLLFYIEGQRWAGRPRPPLRELLGVLPIGVSISLRNSAAVLEGLVGRGGHFHRTPKQGSLLAPIRERMPRFPLAETLMATFFAGAAVSFAVARQWASLPFIFLFLGGYGYAVAQSLRERLSS